MSKGSRGGYNMGGMNRNQMMAQARKMQEQLVAAQQQAAATEVVGLGRRWVGKGYCYG